MRILHSLSSPAPETCPLFERRHPRHRGVIEALRLCPRAILPHCRPISSPTASLIFWMLAPYLTV